MKGIFTLTVLILLNSCSFVSVDYVANNAEVGYLQEKNCSEYIFGFQFKSKTSTPVLLATSSIDKITMIEHEFFFPLIPIYATSCYLITGNVEMTLEERNKKQNLMSDRNEKFKNRKK